MDGGRQDPPGDIEAGRGRRSLHVLDESFDLLVVEEVGVVDDERPVVERVERRRGELPAQPDGTFAGGAAHEPRLAVPGRCLEQHHARDVGTGEPIQQLRARKAHDVEESVSMACPVPRITALIRSPGRE